MAHLLKDYNWSNATSASDFSFTEQKRIHSFFAKSKEVPTTSEDKVPNQKKTDDSAQDKERRVFLYQKDYKGSSLSLENRMSSRWNLYG